MTAEERQARIAEVMFKAWVDLSFMPHAHVVRAREAVKRVETLPFEDMPLAAMLLLTEGKTLIWSNQRITEGLELTEETIH